MRQFLLLPACLLLASPSLAADPYPFAVKVSGSGSPVVLIPGLACDGAVWDTTLDWLAKDHECHVLTLAGFAGQKPVEGPFLETMTKGVLAYITDKKLAKPVLIGHSLGANLAVRVAAGGGDVVGGLVCVDGFPCIMAFIRPDAKPGEMKESGEKERARLDGMAPNEFRNELSTFFSQWLKGDRMAVAEKWLAASDRRTIARAKGELFAADNRPDARKLKTRILVLAAYDPAYQSLVPTADEFGARIAGQYPKAATVAVHPNCKHFLMWDEPGWYKEKLAGFLAGK